MEQHAGRSGGGGGGWMDGYGGIPVTWSSFYTYISHGANECTSGKWYSFARICNFRLMALKMEMANCYYRWRCAVPTHLHTRPACLCHINFHAAPLNHIPGIHKSRCKINEFPLLFTDRGRGIFIESRHQMIVALLVTDTITHIIILRIVYDVSRYEKYHKPIIKWGGTIL